MNKFPYREVFLALEERLLAAGSRNKPSHQIKSYLSKYKKFEGRDLSDDEYFSLLVFVTFYSGFKAATVDSKREVIEGHFPGWKQVSAYTEKDIRVILDDPKMIAHEEKVRGCVSNARKFGELISKHGSFENYINSHSPTDSFENLVLFKETLETTFAYLGKVTSYHFMTDIGLQVLKPDRVICRIFNRLGLIQDEKQLLRAIRHGKNFAADTGFPIRYIDIVFVVYGQDKSPEIGISNGICRKNPRCHDCGISSYCNYPSKNLSLE